LHTAVLRHLHLVQATNLDPQVRLEWHPAHWRPLADPRCPRRSLQIWHFFNGKNFNSFLTNLIPKLEPSRPHQHFASSCRPRRRPAGPGRCPCRSRPPCQRRHSASWSSRSDCVTHAGTVMFPRSLNHGMVKLNVAKASTGSAQKINALSHLMSTMMMTVGETSDD